MDRNDEATSFSPTQWYSQNPRVVLPRALFERVQLGAVQQLQLTATRSSPRSVVEAALREYLEYSKQLRANGQKLPSPEPVLLPSRSPGVRIDAALRAELEQEARRQAAEEQRSVTANHLAAAAVTAYLDRLETPVPGSHAV
ncbi:MAG: hypothetical protein M3R24_33945 [Chloroflexota bacterium]|nr:hypothetical protein [Chloroflexota bacterium]